jgi:hypothetical protein
LGIEIFRAVIYLPACGSFNDKESKPALKTRGQPIIPQDTLCYNRYTMRELFTTAKDANNSLLAGWCRTGGIVIPA